MAFNRCCESRVLRRYKIDHDPKPLDLSADTMKSLEMLLWYVPNIDSVQSYKNDLIENPIYDDFTFSYVLKLMDMKEDDVMWLKATKEQPQIDEELWEYYHDNICVNCQKLIIVKLRTQTKTVNMLRCIRNAVAHGDFSIINDIFIGFNVDNKKNRKAIIKIKPRELLNALDMITSTTEYSKEILFAYEFEKLGYEVLREGMISNQGRYDLKVSKEGKTYVIEIKAFHNRFIHAVELERMLTQVKFYDIEFENENTKTVLVFDKSRLTVDAKKLLSNNATNISVIDINKMNQMAQGIDVLAEL